jgi:hypothetical protein
VNAQETHDAGLAHANELADEATDGIFLHPRVDKQGMDWMQVASFAATLLLAISLLLTVALLRHKDSQVALLQGEVKTAGDVQTCRARFVNEDERLDRIASTAFRTALLAVATGDTAAEQRLDAFNKAFLPLSKDSSAQRDASADACVADRTVTPTFHQIAPFE